jgi:hypothetical protein
VSLPAPESVVTDAVAADAPAPAMNVVVADPDAAGDAELDGDAYVGPDAAVCGHLAAAVRVADERDDVRLHHGDVDLTAAGPWLVLAPLDGAIATVAAGTATTTVHLAAPDARPRSVRGGLDAVLAAATATHEFYPVEDDDAGVFRTGMTTFELAAATPVADGLRVTFDTATTPATTRGGVESRFLDVDAVTAVDVTFEAGVEKSSPGAPLRAAVETAHRRHVGDAGYGWLPRPTAFARIPGGEKVALGAGTPGDRFDGDDVATTAALVRTTVEELEVRA